MTTDVSKHAVGDILNQSEIARNGPIAYASCFLNAAQQNYLTIEKELLAIVNTKKRYITKKKEVSHLPLMTIYIRRLFLHY